MKPLDWQYELHVLGTSKKTLSLDDFADLAKRFADLLGEHERVHFGALKDGSARILAKVDQSARQDVFVQLAKMLSAVVAVLPFSMAQACSLSRNAMPMVRSTACSGRSPIKATN